MPRVLALELRPRRLSEVVGHDKLVARIKGHMESGRLPNVWMFVGGSGSGKTTIARIISVSLQCAHQKEMGAPCADCYEHKEDFCISEINASDAAGVDAARALAQQSIYTPLPGSKYRVYIIDECHRLTSEAQNTLLKWVEDCPATTVWIFCTTDPQKILATLQSRCNVKFKVGGIDDASTEKLVARAVKYLRIGDDFGPLLDELAAKNIHSPRMILNAVELWSENATPQEAVGGSSESIHLDWIVPCLTSGDWDKLRIQLAKITPEAAREMRVAASAYLTATLVSQSIGQRASVLASCVDKLMEVDRLLEYQQVPATCAMFYQICVAIQKGK